MIVEVALPGQDSEPTGWDAFICRAGLPAVWRFDLLAAAAPDSWCPPVVALARDDPSGEVLGVLVGCIRTATTRVRPRRGMPLVLDLRLPGRVAYRESWELAPFLAGSQRRRALAQMTRAVARRLGPLVLGYAYRTVTSAALSDLDHRTVVRPTLEGTVLPVPDSLDQWLSGMQRRRAGSLRSRLRSLPESYQVSVGTSRSDLPARDVVGLLRAQDDRLGSALDPRDMPREEHVAALLAQPDVVTVSYQDHDGQLLAVGLALDTPDELVSVYWAAISPQAGGPKHVYFDHYARLVQVAIATQRPLMRAGRGFAEEKRNLRFSPEPLWFAARPAGSRR